MGSIFPLGNTEDFANWLVHSLLEFEQVDWGLDVGARWAWREPCPWIRDAAPHVEQCATRSSWNLNSRKFARPAGSPQSVEAADVRDDWIREEEGGCRRGDYD